MGTSGDSKNVHGVGSTYSNFTSQFLQKIDSLVQLRGFPKFPLIKYARVAQSDRARTYQPTWYVNIAHSNFNDLAC